MSRHLVNELINYVNNQQPMAVQYFGLYADSSDIGKMLPEIEFQLVISVWPIPFVCRNG